MKKCLVFIGIIGIVLVSSCSNDTWDSEYYTFTFRNYSSYTVLIEIVDGDTFSLSSGKTKTINSSSSTTVFQYSPASLITIVSQGVGYVNFGDA